MMEERTRRERESSLLPCNDCEGKQKEGMRSPLRMMMIKNPFDFKSAISLLKFIRISQTGIQNHFNPGSCSSNYNCTTKSGSITSGIKDDTTYATKRDTHIESCNESQVDGDHFPLMTRKIEKNVFKY